MQMLIHIRQKIRTGGAEADQGSVFVDGGAVVVESDCDFFGRRDGVGERGGGEGAVCV